LRLPAIHLVFGTVRGRPWGPRSHDAAERWPLGTRHGVVHPKHLQNHLDERVFRCNRWKAKAISHGFARLIRHAVEPRRPPVAASYRAPAPEDRGKV